MREVATKDGTEQRQLKQVQVRRELETWGANLLLRLAGLSIDKAKWMFLGCNQ